MMLMMLKTMAKMADVLNVETDPRVTPFHHLHQLQLLSDEVLHYPTTTTTTTLAAAAVRALQQ